MSEISNHPVNAPDILQGFHLIEADAGTGKTWTLASLVVRAIREGRFKLGEILVVTFTKAATSELAERIRLFLQVALDGAIQEAAACAVPFGSEKKNEAERLRLALAQIDQLKVQTIHGFCQSVLGENSFALDLPAQLVLKEGNDSDLDVVLAQWWRDKVLARGLHLDDRLWQALFAAGLSLNVIRRVLRHALSDPDLVILPDADSLGLGFSDEGIRSETLAVDGTAKSEGAESALLQFFQMTLIEQDQAFVAMQIALKKSGSDLLAWLCGPARKLARSGVALGRIYQEKRGQKSLQDLLSSTKVEDLTGKAGAKLVRSFARSVIVELIEESALPFGEVMDACERMSKVLPRLGYANALIAQYLKVRILRSLHEHRKARGELGFDGLLQEVFMLVSRSEQAAKLLRERYPVAMIDESQDTDPLQWAIFEKIYLPADDSDSKQNGGKKSALIMVGDPKQSIYSFRGADVYTYLRASEKVLERHHLSVNRRSSPVVIEAINLMFDEKRLAKPAFNQQNIQFHPALENVDHDWSSVASRYELLRFETEAWSMPDKKKAAVRACVEKITDLRLEAPATDIAVLVFSHAEAALIEMALEQKGVSCARISKENVWQSRWAREMLAILRALAQSNSNAALKRALLTEAFSPEESAQSLQIKVLAALQTWHRIGPQAALSELVLHEGLSLYAYTGYQQLIELLGGELLPRATASEAAGWLEASSQDGANRNASSPWRLSNPGAVKLMTIHHSKGLEFDTVLVPFAWIKEKGANTALEVQRHHRMVQGSWRSVVDTLKTEESKLAIENEKLSENLRLFYVAVTRAKRQLFLFAPGSADRGSPLDYLMLDGFADRISRSAQVSQEAGPAPLLFTDTGVPNIIDSAQEVWLLRAPNRQVVADWRWHSYSALTRQSKIAAFGEVLGEQGGGHGQAPDDRQKSALDRDSEEREVASDALIEAGDSRSVTPEQPLSLRFRFPKGAKAGVVLHSLFEKHPFVRSLSQDQIRAQLVGAGMPEVNDCLDELNDWLDDVLATPLSCLGGAGLNSLPSTQRKTELGFTLEVSQLRWPKVLAAIEKYFPVSTASKALARPDLFSNQRALEEMSKLNGFLNGFVDLLFEHQGRYFVLDWKSNFLGTKPSDYRRVALEQAIAEHDYAVQWCLYSVALLRWLRLKLPGQDPLPKMGGVVYAFIRGMRVAVADSGVYCAEVPAALLCELDALLGGTTHLNPTYAQA